MIADCRLPNGREGDAGLHGPGYLPPRYGNRHSAFTLIEIMVAVSIMAMLVMIISTVFHQGSVAWDSGTGRMKANVMARAAMNLIESDLSQAVAEGPPPWLVMHAEDADADHQGFSSIEFWTLDGDTADGKRVLRRVNYSRDDAPGAGSGRLVRKVTKLDAGDDLLPKLLDPPPPAEQVLATNLVDIRFGAWPAGGLGYDDWRETLPLGVVVRLKFSRQDRVSNLAAWSFGPDGASGTADDIGSW